MQAYLQAIVNLDMYIKGGGGGGEGIEKMNKNKIEMNSKA